MLGSEYACRSRAGPFLSAVASGWMGWHGKVRWQKMTDAERTLEVREKDKERQTKGDGERGFERNRKEEEQRVVMKRKHGRNRGKGK